eukprot:gene7069-7864_t
MNDENDVVVVVEDNAIAEVHHGEKVIQTVLQKETSKLESQEKDDQSIAQQQTDSTSPQVVFQDISENGALKQSLNFGQEVPKENVPDEVKEKELTTEISDVVQVDPSSIKVQDEQENNEYAKEEMDDNPTTGPNLIINGKKKKEGSGEDKNAQSVVTDDNEEVINDNLDESRVTSLQKEGDKDLEEQMQIILPMIQDEELNEEEMNESMPEKEMNEYACDECDKKFTHLSSKKRHMLKHQSGSIPPLVYQCLACSKTFHYNSSLKRHLKLHSDEANGKAYTCKECSKGFMYATSLKRHLKTHSGKEIFPCPHCHRRFEYISSLKRHEKLHLVGKGFRCEICMKTFGYLSSLTRHQRIHQKCLSCKKCDKKFRFHKSYVKHMEEHGVDVSEMKEGTEISETLNDEILDLQAAENHPFVKFVVSQNKLNLEQLQSIQAQQQQQQSCEESSAGEASATATPTSNVTFALVQADNDGTVVENCTMVTEEGQSYADASSVGGIVLVELDQNNKVTERHMEGLQASNLLQLLQAVEGYAVDQTVCLNSDNQEVDESYVAVKEYHDDQPKTDDQTI